MNENLNELDIVLLVHIYKSDASYIKGLLVEDIGAKFPKVSKKTLYKHLKKLIDKKFLSYGVKQSRYNTYHISEKGLLFLSDNKST